MKYLKWVLGGLIGLILIAIIAVRLFVHEPRPEVIEDNADAMAQKMLTAVNITAWDSLAYAKWSFRGEHHYVWDKTSDKAIIKWEDNEVHLDTKSVQGKAFVSGTILDGEEANKVVQTAWGFWCNDMWWFAAPFKVMDPGTKRQIAKDAEGNKGLLVSYASGGVTPGDAYLWYIDESGLPTGYKMWVKIIPIGGVYTSWESWKTLAGGAQVAADHKGNISALQIPITNIGSGMTWSELGYSSNPIKI